MLLERFVFAVFFAMQMLGLYGKPISPPNGWRCVLVRKSKPWKVHNLWLNAAEQDSKIVTDQKNDSKISEVQKKKSQPQTKKTITAIVWMTQKDGAKHNISCCKSHVKE